MSVFNPHAGLAPNLIPNPPSAIPEAPGAGDAMQSLSPFKEALDNEQIIKNLILDRPLKLYIPNKHLYPQWEFRVINNIPAEIADAQNKGWRRVDDPQLVEGFNELVAGIDKQGKAFGPVLMARSKEIGKVVRQRSRKQLQSLYAGMDPKNKEWGSQFAMKVDAKDGTHFNPSGDGWRIKV